MDTRSVTLRLTVEYEANVPTDWDRDMIEFARNEGSWCLNNAIDDLASCFNDNSDACMCSRGKIEYVAEAGTAIPSLSERSEKHPITQPEPGPRYVSMDDTRAFNVTLPDLTRAYQTAREADIDPVSAMWMNICMDCEPGTEPTPGQFTTMCLAIEDVVTGRGFDVDPWRSMDDAPPPKDGTPFLTFSAYAADDPHEGALGITGTTMLVMAWLFGDVQPYPVDEHGDWHDFHCFEHTHWLPLPKPPGETTSAIPEGVKAYLRNALMVGGWRGE